MQEKPWTCLCVQHIAILEVKDSWVMHSVESESLKMDSSRSQETPQRSKCLAPPITERYACLKNNIVDSFSFAIDDNKQPFMKMHSSVVWQRRKEQLMSGRVEVYERPIEGAAGAAQPGSTSRSSEPNIYVMVPNGNGVLALSLAKGVARKRKRSTVPPMVITSSPVKQELERKDKEKKSKEEKKKKKIPKQKSKTVNRHTLQSVIKDCDDTCGTDALPYQKVSRKMLNFMPRSGHPPVSENDMMVSALVEVDQNCTILELAADTDRFRKTERNDCSGTSTASSEAATGDVVDPMVVSGDPESLLTASTTSYDSGDEADAPECPASPFIVKENMFSEPSTS
ncbi:hypothetical protein C0J52_22116 [Blattella germanica]|nr:hypothetical protein C0J52_22116 [Blattella germanica]